MGIFLIKICCRNTMNLAMVMALELRMPLDHTQNGDLVAEVGMNGYLRKMRQPPNIRKIFVLQHSPFRPFSFPKIKSTRQ